MAARPAVSQFVWGGPAANMKVYCNRNIFRRIPLAQDTARRNHVQHQQRRCKSHTGFNSIMAADYNKMQSDKMKKDKMNIPKDLQKKLLAEMRLPGTFIPLRSEEQPREWGPWLEYQKVIWTSWGAAVLSRWALWWQAADGWKSLIRGRSRLNMESRKLVGYGKEMHQRLGRAIADANKDVLDEICTVNLSHSLVTGSIARRTPGEKVRWEVVEYNKVRVVSHHVMPLLSDMVQQVVLAIDSTQKVTRKMPNKKTASAPTVRQMHENFVMMRSIDAKTYKKANWRIWGTLPGTQLVEYKQMMKGLQDESERQIKKKHPEIFQGQEENS
jgi:hypothetical protein